MFVGKIVIGEFVCIGSMDAHSMAPNDIMSDELLKKWHSAVAGPSLQRDGGSLPLRVLQLIFGGRY